MSETTEFKDVYEAIASVSPNRQNSFFPAAVACPLSWSFPTSSWFWEKNPPFVLSQTSLSSEKNAFSPKASFSKTV